MAKYRTINQAYECIKALDAETAVTLHALRQLVVSGQIPSARVGKKYLIDLDTITSYFSASIPKDQSLDFTPGQSDL